MNYIIKRNDDILDTLDKYLIDDYYNIHTVVMLDNMGRPKYEFIDGEKREDDTKICRFCGRNSDQTTFNNKSHIIPKFLGNFLVISNFECDECNAIFSRYETELERYVKIPLIANRNKNLKNRIGKTISRVDGNIEINGDQEKVEFNSLFVLKILLKFAYCMLDDEEINKYTEIKNVITRDFYIKNPNIVDITLRRPFLTNTAVLYESKNTDFIKNIFALNFNMKKYIIFFDKDKSDKVLDDDIIRDQYIRLFIDNDIYKLRVRNFSDTNYTIKFNVNKFLEFLN